MDYLYSHKTTGLVGSQLYLCPLRPSKLRNTNSFLTDASLTCFLIYPAIMRSPNVFQYFCIHSLSVFSVSDLDFCLVQCQPTISLPFVLDKKRQQPFTCFNTCHVSIHTMRTSRPEMLCFLELSSFSLLPLQLLFPKWTPQTGHSISYEALLQSKGEELDITCMLYSCLYSPA